MLPVKMPDTVIMAEWRLVLCVMAWLFFPLGSRENCSLMHLCAAVLKSGTFVRGCRAARECLDKRRLAVEKAAELTPRAPVAKANARTCAVVVANFCASLFAVRIAAGATEEANFGRRVPRADQAQHASSQGAPLGKLVRSELGGIYPVLSHSQRAAGAADLVCSTTVGEGFFLLPGVAHFHLATEAQITLCTRKQSKCLRTPRGSKERPP